MVCANFPFTVRINHRSIYTRLRLYYSYSLNNAFLYRSGFGVSRMKPGGKNLRAPCQNGRKGNHDQHYRRNRHGADQAAQ